MTQRILATFMLALGLATLAGCASPTVITLNDGREIQAVDTPNMTRFGLLRIRTTGRQTDPHQ
jgi:hypothetical protein